MVGRLSSQKGLDLVDYVIADIMHEDVQLVCSGHGRSPLCQPVQLGGAELSRPCRRAALPWTMTWRTAIYAGADLFLMPSTFEPCGLSQMISLRYGTVPVVRETGGLRDTVLSYNEFTGEGNGFTFFNYNAHDMLHVLQRALKHYREDGEVWSLLQERGMAGDYSWLKSAQRYLELYRKLMPVLINEAPKQADPAPDDTPEAKPAAEKKKVKAKPAPVASVKTALKGEAVKPAPKEAAAKPAKVPAAKASGAEAKAAKKPTKKP